MNTVLFHHHGGVHGWDLTLPQARAETYVSTAAVTDGLLK